MPVRLKKDKKSTLRKGAKMTGKFIVIDGTDGSGKATQTKLLVDRLEREGIPVKKIDFPQYTSNVFGKLIRECLDGKHGDFIGIDPRIASTLYAADRFESSKTLRGWIESGYTVIADRYTSANQIHQGGKLHNSEERVEFLSWIETVEFGVFNIPKPDAILCLHVPIAIGQKLLAKRALATQSKKDLAEANVLHLEESLESALSIIERSNNWTKIECTQGGAMLPPEVIHERVFKLVQNILNH